MLTPEDAYQSLAAHHCLQVSRSLPWPVLRSTLKRRGLVVWAGFHPPVTALAPITRENVDKVLHLNLPPLRRLVLTRSSWLLFVALGGTDASLLSLI